MHETNLGTIIKNTRARQIIYAAYVLVALAVGATQAAYAVIDSQPEWLSVVLAVVAYLGVPVGGLAVANAPTQEIAEVYEPDDLQPEDEPIVN